MIWCCFLLIIDVKVGSCDIEPSLLDQPLRLNNHAQQLDRRDQLSPFSSNLPIFVECVLPLTSSCPIHRGCAFAMPQQTHGGEARSHRVSRSDHPLSSEGGTTTQIAILLLPCDSFLVPVQMHHLAWHVQDLTEIGAPSHRVLFELPQSV